MKEERQVYRYNYIYFNATYSNKFVVNNDDYNMICTRDLEKFDNVQIVPIIMASCPRCIKRLYYIHEKLHRRLGIPFLQIWYPFFFKNKFKKVSSKPLCFIIASSQIPTDYVLYLKRKYPTSKFVRVHRDLYAVTCRNGYTKEFLERNFDYQMTFDKNEAEKYGALYFDEIESKINCDDARHYPSCDVFFAGKAKDRLERILSALEIFNKAGLKCFFYVTDVEECDRVKMDGLVYAECFMPYKEMLFRTINSKCILEINQTGAVGYTSRFIEAVMYNKKLITDNSYISKSKFYDKRFIQCIKCVNEIDPSFVDDGEIVDFHYSNEFSPVNIINILEDQL